MALSGLPAHPALPTVPLESTRPRRAGTGKESSGSRRLLRVFPVPSTFYRAGRCLGARPRRAMAEHRPGPGQGPSPAGRALPGRAPAPHLLHDPLRLVGGGPGRRGSPAQHGATSTALLAQLHADLASRAVPGRCRARRWSPRAGLGGRGGGGSLSAAQRERGNRGPTADWKRNQPKAAPAVKAAHRIDSGPWLEGLQPPLGERRLSDSPV